MSILSNLFGSDSESDSSSTFLSDLDAIASLDFSNESSSQSIDDDGSSESSSNSTSLGGDLDVGNLIASITDSSSSSDSDGLFG